MGIGMDDKIFFDKIAESIKEDHPSFSYCFKDESKYMKLLALLAFPFNDRFLEDYTTTIGSKVYFPGRKDLERYYRSYARVLAHEGVHIFDDEKHGWWFRLSYTLFEGLFLPLLALYAVLGHWMPVAALGGGLVASYGVLALLRPNRVEPDPNKWERGKGRSRTVFFVMAGLSVLAYFALSVWLSKWWTLLGLGAFLPLVPFRSPWRARWEYRGYSMGIAISYWKYGRVDDVGLEARVSTFTGPDYYFMDRNANRVRKRLHAIKASVVDGSILEGTNARPYQRTLNVLNELKLTSAG